MRFSSCDGNTKRYLRVIYAKAQWGSWMTCRPGLGHMKRVTKGEKEKKKIETKGGSGGSGGDEVKRQGMVKAWSKDGERW